MTYPRVLLRDLHCKEVSYLKVDKLTKRPIGRPQSFNPQEALDRAVDLFWEFGYENVDVERIARAVNVTKPALYREFGDKSSILFRAVQRYSEAYGAPMLQKFLAEPDITKAVRGLCENAVHTATGEGRKGCMMAAAALGQSERVHDIREYFAGALAAAGDAVQARFQVEIEAGRLAPGLSAHIRSRALIDLTQGILLRAKTGVLREELMSDALGYVPMIVA